MPRTHSRCPRAEPRRIGMPYGRWRTTPVGGLVLQRLKGRDPGGDIFIHGGPRPGTDPSGRDWTAGCIAVTDAEIRKIYAMVKDGTPIDIFA